MNSLVNNVAYYVPASVMAAFDKLGEELGFEKRRVSVSARVKTVLSKVGDTIKDKITKRKSSIFFSVGKSLSEASNGIKKHFNKGMDSIVPMSKDFISEVSDEIEQLKISVPPTCDIAVFSAMGAAFGAVASALVTGALAKAGVITACAPATIVGILIVPILTGAVIAVAGLWAMHNEHLIVSGYRPINR